MHQQSWGKTNCSGIWRKFLTNHICSSQYSTLTLFPVQSVPLLALQSHSHWLFRGPFSFCLHAIAHLQHMEGVCQQMRSSSEFPFQSAPCIILWAHLQDSFSRLPNLRYSLANLAQSMGKEVFLCCYIFLYHYGFYIWSYENYWTVCSVQIKCFPKIHQEINLSPWNQTSLSFQLRVITLFRV